MLRDEYAAQTRQRIIEAFIALLEESEDSSIATSALAKRAGVSLRTVYRYFPSRDTLLAATADWLNTEVFGLASQGDPEGVVKGFQVAVGKFDSRPDLARILALTRIGRSMRSTFRNELASRRRSLLWSETPDISASDRVRAEAVLACLDNVLSWLTLREEFDMEGQDIGATIGWAMELVLNETQRSAQARKKKP